MKRYVILPVLALAGALLAGCDQRPRGDGVLPRETPPPPGASPGQGARQPAQNLRVPPSRR